MTGRLTTPIAAAPRRGDRKRKLALVTGAAGFTGRHLAHALLRSGQGVRALVRSRARARKLERAGAEIVEGDLTRAQEILSQITAIIVRNKQIHEVYGTNGEPLASIWYKPEAPLTWSAGMFVYACRVFEEASAKTSKYIHPKS